MAAVLWHRPQLTLVLVGVLTPVARSEARPESSLMSVPASVLKAAPAAVLGRIPVDMSVSGPASAAVPATGTVRFLQLPLPWGLGMYPRLYLVLLWC